MLPIHVKIMIATWVFGMAAVLILCNLGIL